MHDPVLVFDKKRASSCFCLFAFRLEMRKITVFDLIFQSQLNKVPDCVCFPISSEQDPICLIHLSIENSQILFLLLVSPSEMSKIPCFSLISIENEQDPKLFVCFCNRKLARICLFVSFST